LTDAIVSLLFTDLANSTELFEALGDEGMEDLRRTHFRLLREAVIAQGGTEVKNLGDGLMVVFPSAVDAVVCAVAMQRDVARHNRRVTTPLAVRIGIHVGEPIRDEADYFGTPVVVAKRLCDRADGNQILVSSLVSALAAGRADLVFSDIGPLALKGLSEPVAARAVEWAITELPTAVPLPGPITALAANPFVGREAELADLHDAWATATSGSLQVMFLAGEPGIGKTSLATRLALRVHAEGASVLFGRCDEETLVPYQPFVEAIRGFASAAGAEAPADLEPPVAELSRLLPGVAASGALRGPSGIDSDLERYRLFESVAGFFSEVARTAPVLLVLDDLHWADRSTLALLRHVVRRMSSSAFMVLGTYRHTDLSARHPLSETLGDLRRDHVGTRLRISGLSAADVFSLFETQAGYHLGDAARSLAEAIERQTAGNPFFVSEVLRHLVETGDVYVEDGRWMSRVGVDLGVPEAVREIVGQRLMRLSPSAQETLTIAAVVGSEFSLTVIETAGEFDGDDVIEALEETTRGGLVAEVEGSVGRYRFTHALVRETVYRQVSSPRRARLHHRVADALEDEVAHRPARLAEIAHHRLEGARVGEPGRAILSALAAASHAMSQLAYEQAAQLCERAAEVADAFAVDDAVRADVEIALGIALRLSGDARYRAVLYEAAERARSLGDADRLARAAVELSRQWIHTTTDVGTLEDPSLLALLEEALGKLDERDSGLRARLLAAQAVELAFTPERDRRVELVNEAVAMARRLGDAGALAPVLVSHQLAVFGTAAARQRLEVARELIELGLGLREPAVQFRGQHSRYYAAVEAGDAAAAAQALQAVEELAGQLRQPMVDWQAAEARSVHALLSGHFDEAEALADAALTLGVQSGAPEAAVTAIYGACLIVLRYEQGRLAEMEEVLAGMLDLLPTVKTLPGVLALICCANGRLGDACGYLELACAADLSDAAHDFDRVTTLVIFAWAAALLGDRARAGAIYDDLASSSGLGTVTEHVCLGPVDRTLGLLADVLGREDVAEAHFRRAVAWCERVQAPTWLARTRCDWARFLSTRGRTEDLPRAIELATAAQAGATALGMPEVAAQAAAIVGSCG
jgi:hypothetical protein